MTAAEPAESAPPPPAGPFAVARAWLEIGTQSVGGGPSTLQMIRRVLVQRLAWVTYREYLEDWALSRLSPGVHLVALAGLLGRRTGGVRGTAIAVLALMLPAGLIAALLAAGYVAIRDVSLVRAGLSGAGAMALGLTIGVTYPFARLAARTGRRGLVDWAVLLAAAVVGFAVSPLLVILAGGAVGLAFLGRERPAAPETE